MNSHDANDGWQLTAMIALELLMLSAESQAAPHRHITSEDYLRLASLYPALFGGLKCSYAAGCHCGA